MILLYAIALIIYMLPSLIAMEKRDLWAIVALNALTGWTGIGWVIALVWALIKDKQTE